MESISEDLDFDNQGLSESEWDALSHKVKVYLEKEGYVTEIQTIHKNAYHCRVGSYSSCAAADFACSKIV